MADLMRQIQRQDNRSGAPRKGPGKRSRYGCSCCRKFSCLNHQKKYSRRRAKVKLRVQTQKEIQDA